MYKLIGTNISKFFCALSFVLVLSIHSSVAWSAMYEFEGVITSLGSTASYFEHDPLDFNGPPPAGIPFGVGQAITGHYTIDDTPFMGLGGGHPITELQVTFGSYQANMAAGTIALNPRAFIEDRAPGGLQGDRYALGLSNGSASTPMEGPAVSYLSEGFGLSVQVSFGLTNFGFLLDDSNINAGHAFDGANVLAPDLEAPPLAGFPNSEDINNRLVLTFKDQTNSEDLSPLAQQQVRGYITSITRTDVSNIPLPATGWILLVGLGIMQAVKRKRFAL